MTKHPSDSEPFRSHPPDATPSGPQSPAPSSPAVPSDAAQPLTEGTHDESTGMEGGGPSLGYGENPVSERPVTHVERQRFHGQHSDPQRRPSQGVSGLRVVPTSLHGILDYGLAVVLIAVPWLLGFANGGPAMWVPLILGFAMACYSMMTAYEMGLVGLLSMPVHLGLDLGSGLILAASPWIFGFAETVWVPHLVLGLLEIGSALTSKTVPLFTPARGAPSAMR